LRDILDNLLMEYTACNASCFMMLRMVSVLLSRWMGAISVCTHTSNSLQLEQLLQTSKKHPMLQFSSLLHLEVTELLITSML
jgi:hypothetical protein